MMERERVKSLERQAKKEADYKDMVKREKMVVIEQIKERRQEWEKEQDEKRELGRQMINHIKTLNEEEKQKHLDDMTR